MKHAAARVIFASIAVLVSACAKTLTPEEKAQVQTLRTELQTTKKDVAAAESESARYAGGLIQAMVALRLEILKTNQALLEQRINAIESGAKVTVVTLASKPDADRANQLEKALSQQEVKATEADAKANMQGGLVGAMAAMSAATERNSLAMLRQQYLISKYGLALPQAPAVARSASAPSSAQAAPNAPATAPDKSGTDLREHIVDVTLLRKQYAEQEYQNYIFFDIAFNAKGLDKPARAIKGVLELTDLFGEPQYSLRWTLDKPIQPGGSYTEKGSGFKFNQFIDKHQWVRNTSLENMKAKFRVDEILYQDGTVRKFDD